jgi:Cu+-exporting ATPase
MPNNPVMENAQHTGTTTIHVVGMTCDNCARRVERALRALPGVGDVTVDRAGGVVRLMFDPSLVDLPAMYGAVIKSGYKPVVGSSS